MKVYPIFDRANRAKKDKEGAVHVCISDKGKRKYIHSGVKVLPKHWDERTWVVGRSDAAVLNAAIKDLIDECTLGGGLVTATSFIAFAKQQALQRKASVRQAVALLERFGRLNAFKDVTEEGVRALLAYMEGKGYSAATIRLYMVALRHIAHKALELGYLRLNAFDNVKLPRVVSRRHYLTEEQVQKIKDVELDLPRWRWARDCFIFQCYTGLSYIDMVRLNCATDLVEEGGKRYIIGGRQKTRERYRIMLLPPALEVLARYDYVLPIGRMGYSSYNEACKYVGGRASIRFKTTTHVARHTFATWALSKGLPIEVVSKMLAHTDIKTTQIYAKILQKDVDAGFDKLAEGLG